MRNIFESGMVQSLFKMQMNAHLHPYTCANRDDGKHLPIGSQLGMLIPTVRGWICPFCDYTQDWAHEQNE